jgi:hypothetical protein
VCISEDDNAPFEATAAGAEPVFMDDPRARPNSSKILLMTPSSKKAKRRTCICDGNVENAGINARAISETIFGSWWWVWRRNYERYGIKNAGRL